MQLLEREGALAVLAEARVAAARGDGRVVVVTGEPGIGKTSLVTRFVADLDDDARVLLGACDDLSIPRPLGAIHDLAGSLSPALEEALAACASPHEIHSLLLAELALPPQPTVDGGVAAAGGDIAARASRPGGRRCRRGARPRARCARPRRRSHRSPRPPAGAA